MTDTPEDMTVSLFVVGIDDVTTAQIAALRGMLEEHDHPGSGLRVIDLLETPEDAVTMDILAIPTLIRTKPKPPVRIIGDMSDRARVWDLLSR